MLVKQLYFRKLSRDLLYQWRDTKTINFDIYLALSRGREHWTKGVQCIYKYISNKIGGEL